MVYYFVLTYLKATFDSFILVFKSQFRIKANNLKVVMKFYLFLEQKVLYFITSHRFKVREKTVILKIYFS